MRTTARPGGAADRARGARRRARARSWRSSRRHGPRARDGELAELRPERRARRAQRELNSDGEPPLRQPRHAGALPAGLDDEGRDRGRRARQRGVQARLGRDGRSPKTIGGVPLSTSARARRLRADLADGGAHELGQHRVGRGRREARRRDDVRLHGALRLRRSDPPLDYPQDQTDRERRASRRAASSSTRTTASTSGASRSARAAADRDAAPDGDGGRRRSPTTACDEARFIERMVARTAACRSAIEPTERGNRVMKTEMPPPAAAMMETWSRGHRHRRRRSRASQVAGKTGTAEVATATRTSAWFIGFAPADDPQGRDRRDGGAHVRARAARWPRRSRSR